MVPSHPGYHTVETTGSAAGDAIGEAVRQGFMAYQDYKAGTAAKLRNDVMDAATLRESEMRAKALEAQALRDITLAMESQSAIKRGQVNSNASQDGPYAIGQPGKSGAKGKAVVMPGGKRRFISPATPAEDVEQQMGEVASFLYSLQYTGHETSEYVRNILQKLKTVNSVRNAPARANRKRRYRQRSQVRR